MATAAATGSTRRAFQRRQGALDVAAAGRKGLGRYRQGKGKTIHILRLAGIYGPGRNALAISGRARRSASVKPDQVFNRIHVEDIARAIAAALDEGTSEIWNVTDDEPAPPQDVVTYAAKLMGIAPPPEQDFATAAISRRWRAASMRRTSAPRTAS